MQSEVAKMNVPESIRAGRRSCKCDNVELCGLKEEVIVPYSRCTNSMNWLVEMYINPKHKKQVRWKAHCKHCNKLYFVYPTRKGLVEGMKTTGLPYELREEK